MDPQLLEDAQTTLEEGTHQLHSLHQVGFNIQVELVQLAELLVRQSY